MSIKDDSYDYDDDMIDIPATLQSNGSNVAASAFVNLVTSSPEVAGHVSNCFSKVMDLKIAQEETYQKQMDAAARCHESDNALKKNLHKMNQDHERRTRNQNVGSTLIEQGLASCNLEEIKIGAAMMMHAVDGRLSLDDDTL